MPETPEGVLARLAALGIPSHTVTHPPVFTVAESQALRGSLPGGHTKNLFLRPARGGPGPRLLAVLEETRKLSVNALARLAGAGRVEMAPAEELRAILGVEPGSVTALGAVNAPPGAIRVVIDRALVEDHAVVHVHPLTNTMTTALAPVDLVRFLTELGHPPEILALPSPPDGL